MSDVVFISCLVNEQQDSGIQFSIASQLYQLKLLKAFPFKKVFSFNIDPNLKTRKIEVVKNIHYCDYPLNKLLRLFFVLNFLAYTSRKIQKDNKLLFYNINERNFIPYIYFRFVRRMPCYVLLADYQASEKGSRFRLFHNLLNRSSGILSLSPHIKINSNTLVQELLIDGSEEERKVTEINSVDISKNILFSGSIGYTTGVHVAIEAFKYLPGYTLHISGNMFFDLSKAALLKMIEAAPLKNVHYHGVLNRSDYLRLLNSCSICLSLRDKSLSDHLYNFPSKIGEYLYFNKTVISSMKYVGFEDRLIFTEWQPEQLAQSILSTSFVTINHRQWLIENFGLKAMNQKLTRLFN